MTDPADLKQLLARALETADEHWCSTMDGVNYEMLAEAVLPIIQAEIDRLGTQGLQSQLAAVIAALGKAETELAALRTVARGYCPHCGRGDAAPTVADWEQQRQRADRAQDTLAYVSEWCDLVDREQRPITTSDVREWLKGDRCTRQRAANAASCRCRCHQEQR